MLNVENILLAINILYKDVGGGICILSTSCSMIFQKISMVWPDHISKSRRQELFFLICTIYLQGGGAGNEAAWDFFWGGDFEHPPDLPL